MCFRVAAEGAQFPCASHYLVLISAGSALRGVAELQGSIMDVWDLCSSQDVWVLLEQEGAVRSLELTNCSVFLQQEDPSSSISGF